MLWRSWSAWLIKKPRQLPGFEWLCTCLSLSCGLMWRGANSASERTLCHLDGSVSLNDYGAGAENHHQTSRTKKTDVSARKWELGLLSDWFSSHLRILALCLSSYSYESEYPQWLISYLIITTFSCGGGGGKGHSFKGAEAHKASEVSKGEPWTELLTHSFKPPGRSASQPGAHPIPLGDIWQHPEIVWMVTTGEVAASIQLVETKDCTECSYNA